MYNATDEAGLILTPVAIYSLAATALFLVIAVLFASFFKKSLSRTDYFVIIWLVYDVIVHAVLELPFVVISLVSTIDESDHFLALTWKEYAKADRRWGVSDPTIVSLEILTVSIVEVFAIVLVYAIVKNRYYRHFLQISLCVCELYGGWLTFCPEWLSGSKNLVTDNFLFLWVYLVFFNMLWVVFPVGLLIQSWIAMKEQFSGEMELIEEESTTTTNSKRTYQTRSRSKAEAKKVE